MLSIFFFWCMLFVIYSFHIFPKFTILFLLYCLPNFRRSLQKKIVVVKCILLFYILFTYVLLFVFFIYFFRFKCQIIQSNFFFFFIVFYLVEKDLLMFKSIKNSLNDINYLFENVQRNKIIIIVCMYVTLVFVRLYLWVMIHERN